jgi:hypothetical protein
VIHDRFADAIKKGMTLEQVKNAKLVQDYGRWASDTGFWTTDKFVEAVYESLKPAPAKAPAVAKAPAAKGGKK